MIFPNFGIIFWNIIFLQIYLFCVLDCNDCLKSWTKYILALFFFRTANPQKSFRRNYRIINFIVQWFKRCNLTYANHTIVSIFSKVEKMNRPQTASERNGLKLNKAKLKLMIVHKPKQSTWSGKYRRLQNSEISLFISGHYSGITDDVKKKFEGDLP